MKLITVNDLIKLLQDLPEDVKDKEIRYVDFANCDVEEVVITLDDLGHRVIIRE